MSVCVFLQYVYAFNSTITAATIAFIASFLIEKRELKDLLYIATFCSMGISTQNKYFLIHASAISVIILICYKIFQNKFLGHGGKLGSLAFISSLIYFTLGFYVFS